jgi:acyl carrier protein
VTNDEIRATVIRVLQQIAPETDPARIDPHASLRDQLDLDSMDVLNVMIGLHDALHVDIPETDYAKLGTLDEAVAYLARCVGSETGRP